MPYRMKQTGQDVETFTEAGGNKQASGTSCNGNSGRLLNLLYNYAYSNGY